MAAKAKTNSKKNDVTRTRTLKTSRSRSAVSRDGSKPSAQKKIRYAVVGLGHIAQTAVLPGFKNARKNSELVALVSSDPKKLKKLSRTYNTRLNYSYEQYDELLKSGEIDAVYIALPNHMHREYTERAAKAGLHVLCEKPMAVTPEDCEAMIKVSEENNVKLMIAYRLHFEEANLKAIETATSGKLGEMRIFESLFTMQVTDPDNIRLKKADGGGTLFDIGIYCINAARYIFQDEPVEVLAVSANSGDKRFSEVDEMTSAILKFPNERLASFTCSFGAANSANYQIVGTKGVLRVESAYEYSEEISHRLSIKDKVTKKTFRKRDQFGPELVYFSDCILKNKTPEPGGLEGLADVKVIEALYESAASSKPVRIEATVKQQRPNLDQEIDRPAVEEPEQINVVSPHG